jgi:hypothetical protein
MSGLGQQMIALARQSLEDPRASVRSLLAIGVPLPARTIGLLLMAVASALLAHLSILLLPPSVDPAVGFMMQSPLRAAIIQWLVFVAMVFLIYRIGRAWGGKGNLPDTLLVVVWLQVIMLGVQFVQLLVFLLVPPLAGIVNLAGLVLFFWLMTSFIAELHGFASRGKVLAGILVAIFGVAMVLVLILALILGPEALGNV